MKANADRLLCWGAMPKKLRAVVIFVMTTNLLRTGTVAFCAPLTLKQTCQSTRRAYVLLYSSVKQPNVRAYSTVVPLHAREKSVDSDLIIDSKKLRQDVLHDAMRPLYLDPKAFEEANMKNMRDPSVGYDPDIGKPAIRTYRSFIYPKKNGESISLGEDGQIRLAAAAERVARQIDFLRRRHRAHETDWVRHTDNTDAMSAVKEICLQSRQAFPLILVLDNVRSAFNVGSIFRTADACGCQKVITTGITAHPNGSGAEKLSKSALGAEKLVLTQHFKTTTDAITTLKEAYPDWIFIGLETTANSQLYTEVEYPEKCFLILGNEVTGLDPVLMTELDAIIEIPMFGAKNSLNIAACAPVVLYEILRQWKANKQDR